MTSRICAMMKSAKRFSDWGFTLIELLLVVSLIVLLAALVYPNLSHSTRAHGVIRVAEDVAEFIRYARVEAVRTETSTRLEFDRRREHFWLSRQAPESVEHDAFVPFEDKLLGTPRALGQVKVTRILVEGQPYSLSYLLFTPNGVSKHTVLEFSGDESQQVFVAIGPWVDDVSVLTELPELNDDDEVHQSNTRRRAA